MGLSLFAKALELKEIKVNKTGPQYVHIDAFSNGFIQRLYTLLDVYGDHIEYIQGSSSEYTKTNIPLSSLSVITGGSAKSILLLIWSSVMFFAGGGLALALQSDAIMLGLWIVAAVFFMFYVRSKRLVIKVVASSGQEIVIYLKVPRIIKEDVDTIVKTVTQLATAQTARNDHASGETI